MCKSNFNHILLRYFAHQYVLILNIFRKFSSDVLYNDLIILMYVLYTIVKVFKDYHDLLENRIIRPWLNNASTAPYVDTPLVYNIEMCARGFVKLPINVNANNNSSELYFRRNDAT